MLREPNLTQGNNSMNNKEDTTFLWCSLAAGSIAKDRGKFEDSEYVKRLAYALYETANKLLKERK